VTDDVLKLGYTSVIFLDLGVKVDGTYYCDLLLSQRLLPAIRQYRYVMSLASLYFRKQCHNIIEYAMFSDINISQGSVATPLRFGEICNDPLIANFLLID